MKISYVLGECTQVKAEAVLLTIEPNSDAWRKQVSRVERGDASTKEVEMFVRGVLVEENLAASVFHYFLAVVVQPGMSVNALVDKAFKAANDLGYTDIVMTLFGCDGSPVGRATDASNIDDIATAVQAEQKNEDSKIQSVTFVSQDVVNLELLSFALR